MQIVLPGALPDPAEARELTAHVQRTAPTLARWMQNAQARIVACDTARTACTPYEQWLLNRSGFTIEAGQNLSCGLGPLLEPENTEVGKTDRIWLAELVHIAPARDGAALLPARDLAIEPDQSLALFEAAQGIMAESGFTIGHAEAEHWRVTPRDETALPASVSPSLVGATSVNDWWPQDAATRPWRRLANELQMLWFDHPVNQARAEKGLPAVNSLWVFGGARRNQFRTPSNQAPAHTHFDLMAAQARHDWGSWLSSLGSLEKSVFEPLARNKVKPALVLIGRERFVELRPGALRQLTQWLPGGRDAWRNWWSPPN